MLLCIEGSFEPPPLWTDMTGNLRVVVLQPTSKEYTDIAQQFTASAGAGFTVVKVCIFANAIIM